MAQREKGGRVVFIGNIPYGVSEEQIMDIFGRAGQVVNFRLVYDKETGQPKGFGFLEYTDTDAAASAVRNLNEYDLGGRTLRVDYSNDNRSTNNSNQNQNQDNNRAPPPFNMNGKPFHCNPISAASTDNSQVSHRRDLIHLRFLRSPRERTCRPESLRSMPSVRL